MKPAADDGLIPETTLLRDAADWLANRRLDAAGLHQAASERGLDFATAVLYHALRQSPRHGPLMARLEQATPAAPASFAADIVIVPGAFYKEKPETGADGQIIKDIADRWQLPTTTVPLHSFGRVAANAAILADCLKQSDRQAVVVSHSKGTTEIRHLLARPDAGEIFRGVRAWVDLSGLFHGTPLVDWLRTHRLNWWLVRLLFWWKGFAIKALDDIAADACPPWPEALRAVPHLEVLHVVGFPLQRHLSTPLARRGQRRLAPLGPSDGTILLGDVLSLPGRVYPVWGADHYLRPQSGRDMRQSDGRHFDVAIRHHRPASPPRQRGESTDRQPRVIA